MLRFGSASADMHFAGLPVHAALVISALRTTPDHPFAVAMAGAVVDIGRETFKGDSIHGLKALEKSFCKRTSDEEYGFGAQASGFVKDLLAKLTEKCGKLCFAGDNVFV